MLKTLSKVSTEGTLHNIIKAIHEKSTVNIIKEEIICEKKRYIFTSIHKIRSLQIILSQEY